MTRDETKSGDGGRFASVRQEDPCPERVMEDEQRRQDDGIGVPPEANPHGEVSSRDKDPPGRTAKSSAPSAPSYEPWRIGEAKAPRDPDSD